MLIHTTKSKYYNIFITQLIKVIQEDRKHTTVRAIAHKLNKGKDSTTLITQLSKILYRRRTLSLEQIFLYLKIYKIKIKFNILFLSKPIILYDFNRIEALYNIVKPKIMYYVENNSTDNLPISLPTYLKFTRRNYSFLTLFKIIEFLNLDVQITFEQE